MGAVADQVRWRARLGGDVSRPGDGVLTEDRFDLVKPLYFALLCSLHFAILVLPSVRRF